MGFGMIITKENGLTTLFAEDGMTLHKDGFLSKQVILGCNSLPKDWDEITDAEAEAIQKEIEGGEQSDGDS